MIRGNPYCLQNARFILSNSDLEIVTPGMKSSNLTTMFFYPDITYTRHKKEEKNLHVAETIIVINLSTK